jgi:hypothetical protein
LKQFNVAAGQLPPLITLLESGEIRGRDVREVAAAIQAAAVIAAFDRSTDAATQERFREIFELTDLRGEIAERQRRLVRSFQRFSMAGMENGVNPRFADMRERSPAGNVEPERTEVTTRGERVYEVLAAPGCIVFGQGAFSFMVKASWAAASCERPGR